VNGRLARFGPAWQWLWFVPIAVITAFVLGVEAVRVQHWFAGLQHWFRGK